MAQCPCTGSWVCSDISDSEISTVFQSQAPGGEGSEVTPSLIPVEPGEEGLGFPHQLHSSSEDVRGSLGAVSQPALDQALEGLGPF